MLNGAVRLALVSIAFYALHIANVMILVYLRRLAKRRRAKALSGEAEASAMQLWTKMLDATSGINCLCWIKMKRNLILCKILSEKKIHDARGKSDECKYINRIANEDFHANAGSLVLLYPSLFWDGESAISKCPSGTGRVLWRLCCESP